MEKNEFWSKLCELQEVSKKIGKIKKFNVQRSEDYRLLLEQKCLGDDIFKEFVRLSEIVEAQSCNR